MDKNDKYHIGWRNIKTSLAVFICLLLGYFVKEGSPLYACTAAVICMKDSIKDSVKQGIVRMKATIIGGIIAIGFLAVSEHVFFNLPKEMIAPMAVMLTIYCCGILGWKEASALASVVVLVILLMSNNGQNKYLYAVNRIIETLMGIVVAVVVNKYIVPPKSKFEDEEKVK